jgi:(2R)-ethylmalonyl-CoA mutase
MTETRTKVQALAKRMGGPPKMLIGKPGLDGHANGADQFAEAARDSGNEVFYTGIRLTPARIANSALEEGVHLVGLSVLSGSHLPLVTEVVRRMRDAGIGEVPVVVGGIVPDEDAAKLRLAGVARIYTPKDFDVTRIMGELVELIEAGTSRAA